VLRIGYSDMGGSNLLLWPERAFWDVDPEIFNHGGMAPRIVDLGQQPPLQLLYYPKWRLCKYLPLEKDNRYTNGLTVYCTVRGIVGIVAHHACADERIGSLDGYPMHFSLGSEERIVLVCLMTIGPAHRKSVLGPFLLVRIH
jgi:hypothetical protein